MHKNIGIGVQSGTFSANVRAGTQLSVSADSYGTASGGGCTAWDDWNSTPRDRGSEGTFAADGPVLISWTASNYQGPGSITVSVVTADGDAVPTVENDLKFSSTGASVSNFPNWYPPGTTEPTLCYGTATVQLASKYAFRATGNVQGDLAFSFQAAKAQNEIKVDQPPVSVTPYKVNVTAPVNNSGRLRSGSVGYEIYDPDDESFKPVAFWLTATQDVEEAFIVNDKKASAGVSDLDEAFEVVSLPVTFEARQGSPDTGYEGADGVEIATQSTADFTVQGMTATFHFTFAAGETSRAFAFTFKKEGYAQEIGASATITRSGRSPLDQINCLAVLRIEADAESAQRGARVEQHAENERRYDAGEIETADGASGAAHNFADLEVPRGGGRFLVWLARTTDAALQPPGVNPAGWYSFQNTEGVFDWKSNLSGISGTNIVEAKPTVRFTGETRKILVEPRKRKGAYFGTIGGNAISTPSLEAYWTFAPKTYTTVGVYEVVFPQLSSSAAGGAGYCWLHLMQRIEVPPQIMALAPSVSHPSRNRGFHYGVLDAKVHQGLNRLSALILPLDSAAVGWTDIDGASFRSSATKFFVRVVLNGQGSTDLDALTLSAEKTQYTNDFLPLKLEKVYFSSLRDDYYNAKITTPVELPDGTTQRFPITESYSAAANPKERLLLFSIEKNATAEFRSAWLTLTEKSTLASVRVQLSQGRTLVADEPEGGGGEEPPAAARIAAYPESVYAPAAGTEAEILFESSAAVDSFVAAGADGDAEWLSWAGVDPGGAIATEAAPRARLVVAPNAAALNRFGCATVRSVLTGAEATIFVAQDGDAAAPQPPDPEEAEDGRAPLALSVSTERVDRLGGEATVTAEWSSAVGDAVFAPLQLPDGVTEVAREEDAEARRIVARYRFAKNSAGSARVATFALSSDAYAISATASVAQGGTRDPGLHVNSY